MGKSFGMYEVCPLSAEIASRQATEIISYPQPAIRSRRPERRIPLTAPETTSSGRSAGKVKMYFADIGPSVLENYAPAEIASLSPPF